MSTSSSKKRGQFWRADWFVALLVVVVVIVLHSGTDFISTLERRFYDFGSTATARQPSDRIAVIAIDDQSISNIGRWPWPRDVHAQLIDQLTAAKAKTIVHTTFFFEPQTDRGLEYIRRMKDALASSSDAASVEQIGRLIAEAEAALDTDAKFAASIARAGNVLLPSYFTLGQPQGRPDADLPAYALKSAMDEDGSYGMSALRGTQPIEILGSAASGIGHLNQLNDVDGSLRDEPLLVNYFGKAVPSMALLAAARSLNLRPEDIKLNIGQSVQLGRLQIRTDELARMLPQFYRPRDGKPAFAVDSFYDVISGKIPASKYADKIVIIGATATGVGVQFPVPGYPSLSPAETIA
ncbi:MAG: CHASE2 domain-containing protein, partial [Lysobacteraceae bacterium]